MNKKALLWQMLMLVGIICFTVPYIAVASDRITIILLDTPQTVGFENGLVGVDVIYNTPTIVSSPVASGTKAAECQRGDQMRWDLEIATSTIDLSFKGQWTNFPLEPSTDNGFIAIYGAGWDCLALSKFYCNAEGYRGWQLWTNVPTGRGSYVSNSEVYLPIATDTWHTMRLTVDTINEAIRLYLNGNEVASLTSVTGLSAYSVSFFILGTSGYDTTAFYDDVTYSTLTGSSPPPPPQEDPPAPTQWEITISYGAGGSTSPTGTVNVNSGEDLTVVATPQVDYVFDKWTFDGNDYSTEETIVIPAQPDGSAHWATAFFESTIEIPSEPPQTGQWQVNIQAGTGGTVSPSGYVNVNVGEDLTVVATSNSGYTFSGWIFDGVAYDLEKSVTIVSQADTSTHTLIANFVEAPSQPSNPTQLNKVDLSFMSWIGIGSILMGGIVFIQDKKILKKM